LDTALIVLALVALFASFVNGALSYGFASLTVPLALLFFTNRILHLLRRRGRGRWRSIAARSAAPTCRSAAPTRATDRAVDGLARFVLQ
jgi:uncharacterized membrane protein YfcA